MNRREVLGLMGTGVVGVTAGCAGFGGGGGRNSSRTEHSGTPAFDVAIDVPSPVPLGTQFSATVTVTNTGDGPGTYEGTLGAFTDMVDEESQPVRVGPVAPGGTVETTVGPMVASYAGGWAVELDRRTGTFDVIPRTVTAGTTVELAGRFEISVDAITVRDSYDYRTSGGEAGTHAAGDGSAFVFATVSVTNLTDDGLSAPSRSEFAGSTADGFYPVHFGRVSWDAIRFDGRPYPGRVGIDPGDSVDGWVVLTVGTSTTDTVGVAWNRDLVTSPPEVLWRPSP
jgi:hypothetical protein